MSLKNELQVSEVLLNVITNGEEKPSNVITPENGCKPLKENGAEILDENNILEMPDNTSDDGVGLSDTPIMRVSSENKDKTTKKPTGSAYGCTHSVTPAKLAPDLVIIGPFSTVKMMPLRHS